MGRGMTEMKTRTLGYRVLLLIAILATVIPVVKANQAGSMHTIWSFQLPGNINGGCSWQPDLWIETEQGDVLTGVVTSNSSVSTAILNNTEYQAFNSKQVPCSNFASMGFVNSGPTTHYSIHWTAPYTAESMADRYYVVVLNAGSKAANVTINLLLNAGTIG